MTPLDGGHHHVESGKRPLQLQPRQPAPTGCVRAQRVLDHQALVAALACLSKDPVEVGWTGRFFLAREQKWMLDIKALEQLASRLQRLVEE